MAETTPPSKAAPQAAAEAAGSPQATPASPPAEAAKTIDLLGGQIEKLGDAKITEDFGKLKAAVASAGDKPSDEALGDIREKAALMAVDMAILARKSIADDPNGEKLKILKSIGGNDIVSHDDNQLKIDFFSAARASVQGTRADIDISQTPPAKPESLETLAGKINTDARETLEDVTKLLKIGGEDLDHSPGRIAALKALKEVRAHLDEKIRNENYYGDAQFGNQFRHDMMRSVEASIDETIRTISTGQSGYAIREKLHKVMTTQVGDHAGLDFVARGELLRGAELQMGSGNASQETQDAIKTLATDGALADAKLSADAMKKGNAVGDLMAHSRMGDAFQATIDNAIFTAEKAQMNAPQQHDSSSPLPPLPSPSVGNAEAAQKGATPRGP